MSFRLGKFPKIIWWAWLAVSLTVCWLILFKVVDAVVPAGLLWPVFAMVQGAVALGLVQLIKWHERFSASQAKVKQNENGMQLDVTENLKEALGKYSAARRAYVSLGPASPGEESREVSVDFQTALEALGYQLMVEAELQGLKV